MRTPLPAVAVALVLLGAGCHGGTGDKAAAPDEQQQLNAAATTLDARGGDGDPAGPAARKGRP